MLKICGMIAISLMLVSCNTVDQRNPKMDTDPFENYKPWWATNNWSTNEVIILTTNGFSKGK